MGGGAFEGSRHLDYTRSRRALELSKEIYYYRGSTLTVFARPAGMKWLVLVAQSISSWRMRPGDNRLRVINLHDATGNPDGECLFGTAVPHGFTTGDGPYKFNETGTLPAEIDDTTLYWVIVITATRFQVALSWNDAQVGSYVVFTDDGVPTNEFPAFSLAAPVASVLDGYGALLMEAGGVSAPLGYPSCLFVMPAPEELTIQGSGGGASLAYWWLP